MPKWPFKWPFKEPRDPATEALRRIEDGSYGYCEETGEPIGIPRLIARPTATLTIEAQSRREQKQKLYGE